MALLKRATDQTQSEWRPVPEGLWRWVVGIPELRLSERCGNYQVRFPLTLTEAERTRLMSDYPLDSDDAEGTQQSWRTNYTVGLSLGYVQRDGQYKSTKLVDFLAACLGAGNVRKFREWIAQGGGPPRPDDLDDQQAELRAIGDWLQWWQDLEVYGTITHRMGDGTTFANFAGPMPVGSLPGQKDNEYDALGRGKLRAIITESGETRESHSREHRGLEKPPAAQYTAQGEPVRNTRQEQHELEDLPF